MGEDDKNTFEREREIFFEALEKKTEGSRANYLEETCGNDAAMLERVRGMLSQHGGDETKTFLKPADIPQPGMLMEREGSVVDNYQLVEKLGEGGFGVVWMAEQEKPVKRKVALKLIKPGMDSAEVIARFGAERQALAVMDHPNIAKVFDAGATESGRPYFVMELAKGVPITDFCDRERLDTKERLKLFSKVCSAVQHAHQKAVIHRDLKPSNILVVEGDDGPVPMVIDFGIAKAIGEDAVERTAFTAHGQLVGTPQYMSPEQAGVGASADIDTRSDVYSLGVVLYELLVGSPPFDVDTLRSAGFEGMCRIIREEEPPRPSHRLSTASGKDESIRITAVRGVEPQKLSRQVRGDLDWIVMKALEKDRVRRYGSAGELAEDIGRHLSQKPVLAGPPSARYRMGKFVRRNRGRLVAGGVAAAALLIGLAVAGMVWFDAEFERRQRTAEVENRATALLDEGEMLMAANSTANSEDDSDFRRAQELARRLNEMVGLESSTGELRSRHDTFQHAVLEEGRARQLVGMIEEAILRKLGALGADSSGEEVADGFRSFGVVPSEMSIEEVKDRLDTVRNPLRSILFAGLSTWESAVEESDPSFAERLAEIIARADSDPWRRSLRKALDDEDMATLLTLTESPEFGRQSSENLIELALALFTAEEKKAGEELLRRIHRERLSDFWSNFWLGFFLLMDAGGEDDHDFTVTAKDDLEVSDFQPNLKRLVARPVAPAELEGVGFLRAAAATRPDVVSAWIGFGVALKRVGRHDEAVSAMRQASRINPDDISPLLFLAIYLVEQEEFAEVLEISERIIDLDPQIGIGYRFRVMALANVGKYKEAKEVAKRGKDLPLVRENVAVRINSKPGSYGIIAGAALSRGDYDEAISSAKRAIGLDPGDALSHGILGLSYAETGLSSPAILSFQKAIELEPELVDGYTNLGLALAGRGDYDGALSCAKVAQKLDPENPQHLVNIGAVFGMMNEDDEALPYFEKALAMDPDFAMAHFNLGQILVRRGDTERAVTYFRKVLELDPNYQEAKDALEAIAINSGNPIEAVEILRRLIVENPDKPERHAKLGELLGQMGKFKEATQSLQKALSLDPNHADAHSNLGFVCVQLGKFSEAVDHSRRALEIDSKHELAHGNLVIALMSLGRKEEALAACQSAIQIIPDSAKAHGNLANTYLNLGRIDEAVDSCRKSLSLDPELATTHRVLGAALFKLGRIDEAAGSYRRSVELDPNYTVATAHMALFGGEISTIVEEGLVLTRKAYGDKDPKTAAALLELSAILLANGRPDQALPLARQAVDLNLGIYGEKHPETVKAMFILAGIYMGSPGRAHENVAFLTKVLSLCKEVLGQEHEMTLGSMTNLAAAHAMLEQWDQATALEEEALKLKRRWLPGDHRFLKQALSMMAKLYDKSGRPDDAIRIGEEVLAWTREYRGVNDPETHAAVANLIDYLEPEEKLEEIGKLVSEQLELLRKAGEEAPPENRELYQVSLDESSDRLAANWEIPDSEVEDYYAANEVEFTEDVAHLHTIMIKKPIDRRPDPVLREKALALHDEIVGGRPFEEVARAHSEDLWKDRGGDRGEVLRGWGACGPEMDPIIFAMKPGAPEVHEGKNAFWILRVDERKSGEAIPLDEVRMEIRQVLRDRKKTEFVDRWHREAREVLGKDPAEAREEGAGGKPEISTSGASTNE